MCTKSFPRESCQDMRHRIFCSLSVLNWFKFEKVCSFVQICIRRCPCSLLQDGTVSVPLKSTEATDARKEADELHLRSRTNCTSILNTTIAQVDTYTFGEANAFHIPSSKLALCPVCTAAHRATPTPRTAFEEAVNSEHISRCDEFCALPI